MISNFKISEQQGLLYSKKTGDKNKIHLSKLAAYNSHIGKKICHGTLVTIRYMKLTNFFKNLKKLNKYSINIKFDKPFIYNEKMNTFANSHEASKLMIFAYISLFLSVLLPICFENLVKTSPSDYIILFIYTATEAYILGIVCARNNVQAVFLAAGTTLVITLAMTLFACQTKYDCTGAGGFLLTSLCGIVAINIINIFIGSSSVNLWTACASVVLFSAYIVYDTQLIVGGAHKKYQFSTDDHVLATISIHLDMVNLFLNILQILTSSRD